MTDELDLLTGYMADAPDPDPNVMEASRRILELAIEEEHVPPAQRGAASDRSRSVRRSVRAGALVAVAAAAVLIAALVLPTSSPPPPLRLEGGGRRLVVASRRLDDLPVPLVTSGRPDQPAVRHGYRLLFTGRHDVTALPHH